MARALGVSPRHMRRLAAGDAPITAGIEADIRKMLGGTDIPDPDWPRDKWIIGDAPPEEDTQARREYIMHTKHPRFIARIVQVDDEGRPEKSEEPTDILAGHRYASEDYVLCEIVWIDPPPSPEKLLALMEEACDAIDASAE